MSESSADVSSNSADTAETSADAETSAEDHFDPKEQAIVTCSTTKGTFVAEFHRHWSPLGYDRAVGLFEQGFYDRTHFFRVLPNFLVQFGISYNLDLQDQSTIRDDPQLNPRIPFLPGTIAFAGGGINSRDAQLFVALDESDDPQWGKEDPWETPVGRVVYGLEEVFRALYSYGNDDEAQPDQQEIYTGRAYIEEHYPHTDSIHDCHVERLNEREQLRRYVLHQQEQHQDGQQQQAIPAKTMARIAAATAGTPPLDPVMAAVGCAALVLVGVLGVRWIAPKKMDDKRN